MSAAELHRIATGVAVEAWQGLEYGPVMTGILARRLEQVGRQGAITLAADLVARALAGETLSPAALRDVAWRIRSVAVAAERWQMMRAAA